ncbi:alpha/beta hydrolase [Asanoa sp. WMMD1127]|uniref:alpha/beta hydrolase n=1 Tax=Asanoa sp. WMMD1127 TaxID=3016107 RepID=UPI002415F0E1|nr:alpha/beta hydrolase [Asanoa sp. WMMD1127]MDG4826662.1 alpha/beta hydrolase [Asanoa sp. WMMD1127]
MVGRVMTLRALARVAVAGATACLLGVPPAAAASDGPPAELPGVAWGDCDGLGAEFQCARVAVPLDWDDPSGEQIELAVIRRLASRPDERIGSMFVNPGGPGQSGVGLVRDSGADLDEWGDGRFDIVGWDPRGTNDSTPVRCFADDADEAEFWAGVTVPSTPAESAAYQEKTVDLARRCGEVSGDLLSHITTADTARDLDRLRALVGEEKITYVGLSYGSMIGQTYANLFPGRVRAMVLDGLVDAVDQTSSMEANVSNAVSAADEVFAQFVALCQAAATGECALAGHGEPVADRVARLFARARLAPLPAPNADPPGELSYGDLLVSTFNPLRLPLTWPQFAADLDAAAEGDATALLTAARAMQTPVGYRASVWSSAVSCGDGPARVSSADWPAQVTRFTTAGELWGPVLAWWLWAPCASGWPADATGRYAGPWNARTENPILLLSARYDPGTPYRNAVTAESRLGNAVLLTLDGYGHPSYQVPSACLDEARQRYLVDLVTPPKGTTCQPDDRPFG